MGEHTGKVPFSWMYVRDLIMSGMERDSGQSQSTKPSVMGSLEMLVWEER
jgi:hypothetical protein